MDGFKGWFWVGVQMFTVGGWLWGAAPEPSTEEMAVLEGLAGRDALFWTHSERLVGLRYLEHLKPVRSIPASEAPQLFVERPGNFADFGYAYDGEIHRLDEHLVKEAVVGLAVVRDGELILERYRAGASAETRWNDFSVAKSVLGLLLVQAVERGVLPDLETALVAWLPGLKGTAYEPVRLIDLMRMSSGVAWNEDYTDPASDVSRLAEFTAASGFDGLVAHMGTLPRVVPVGEAYNYNTGEIYLAGAVLAEAAGETLAALAADWLWGPLGMERAAVWMLNAPDGLETAGCCIAATLRDHARLGWLLASDGHSLAGQRLIGPEALDALFEPTSSYPRYGALWFRDGDSAVFAAGIFGQLIYVDRARRVVVAMHSSWPEALPPERLARRNAFVRALVDYSAALEN